MLLFLFRSVALCVLMTSSCPKCGGGQVFAVGLEEGEVGADDQEAQ